MKGGAKIYVGPPFLRQRWGHGPVGPPPGSALANESFCIDVTRIFQLELTSVFFINSQPIVSTTDQQNK